MLEIRWAPLAQDDLEAIDGHYVAIDPALSLHIGHRLITGALFLSDTPFAGPLTGDRDRRKWRVRGTPYILIYLVASDHLRILRVFHASRDPRSR